jgi:putrescine aminotransferase
MTGFSPADRRLLDLAERRMRLTAPAFARAALVMGCGVHEGGEGCEIIDHNGRRLLDLFDAYGNQAFGYGHPRLLAALSRQLGSGHTNGVKVFFDEMPIRLAEALAVLTRGALPCSFLTNGGAEAIEHALKLARAHTGRRKFVTAQNAYHGKTWGALSAACRPEYEAMFAPMLPEFHAVPFGDAAALERAVDADTAAVLIETVQSEGGVVVPPPGYLERLRDICDRTGTVLILDEIQCGFGRTGRFFAFEHAGILPDIVCIGKSFGGGMLPVAAVIARESLWTPFRVAPLAFGSSLGGSPMSSAIGLETLAMASDPAFLDAVAAKGRVVERRLAALAAAHPALIAGVRGVGLLHGIVVTNPAISGLVLRLLYERGVLTSFCLFDVSVLRIEPPLIIADAQLEQALDALDAVFAEAAGVLRDLPPGEIGRPGVDVSLDVAAPPTALGALLRAPGTLPGLAPLVLAWQAAPDGGFTIQGRLDDIPLEWHETILDDGSALEQRATAGFWQSFTRRWQVAPGPEGRGSRLTLSIGWDVGSGGFEYVMSLRLRCAMEREGRAALGRIAALAVAPARD